MQTIHVKSMMSDLNYWQNIVNETDYVCWSGTSEV